LTITLGLLGFDSRDNGFVSMQGDAVVETNIKAIRAGRDAK